MKSEVRKKKGKLMKPCVRNYWHVEADYVIFNMCHAQGKFICVMFKDIGGTCQTLGFDV